MLEVGICLGVYFISLKSGEYILRKILGGK